MVGMFDDVRCEVPLPDGWEGQGLQSKDFDCEMSLLTIRADGRLVYDRRNWRERDPATAEDLDFHGYFHFYGSEGRESTPEWRWHEYRAKFTDGQLVGIDHIREAQ